MLLNCGVGEDFWEPLGLKEDQTSQFLKEISPAWISIRRTDAEITILWPLDVKNCLIRKDPMLGKIERAGDDREWDGWMASLTWWTWAWASSGSLVVDGKPGVLQSMGSQSQTCLSNWTELKRQPSPLCLSNGPTPPNPSLFVPPYVPALSCRPFPPKLQAWPSGCRICSPDEDRLRGLYSFFQFCKNTAFISCLTTK